MWFCAYLPHFSRTMRGCPCSQTLGIVWPQSRWDSHFHQVYRWWESWLGHVRISSDECSHPFGSPAHPQWTPAEHIRGSTLRISCKIILELQSTYEHLFKPYHLIWPDYLVLQRVDHLRSLKGQPDHETKKCSGQHTHNTYPRTSTYTQKHILWSWWWWRRIYCRLSPRSQ